MTPPQAGPGPGPAAANRDERLGEAVEAYLELLESGRAPALEAFVSRYPDLAEELQEALDGLALVQGLVGSGVGPGGVGPRRLEAGYRVAGYRIVRELGRGGMGVVYEAVHVDLDRPVALKILGGHAAPGSSGRRRFLNEAKTAAGLHHTHIVPVFDVGQVGGLCYYAMQRIEGSGLDRVLRVLRRDRLTASGSPSGRAPSGSAPETLSLDDDHDEHHHSASGSGLLSVPGRSESGSSSWAPGLHAGVGAARRDDRPPPFEPPLGSEYYRWVARVGQQAAEALSYAHRRGVVHRDVKPSNLLVDARGVVWVADFGLARRLEDPGQTRGDGLVGTPRYMSPEQAEGRPIGPATDVYSLGATLYELLTLRPPFDGQSTAELVRQIADRDPPSPRKFARRLPRDLETIVLKAMSKRPGDRYASAAELAEDLARFLAFEPVRARRISPVGRSWRLAQRHPAASIVSSLAALAILATAAFAYVRIANERDRVADALEKQRAATRAEQVARGQLAEALEKQRAATRASETARARELLSKLPLLSSSTMPRRREAGRAILREAAELTPDRDTIARLRDQAIELLMSRDLEDRPALATGTVRGLVPLDPAEQGASGPVAALGEDGQTLTLWDAEERRALMTHQLHPPAPLAREGEQEESAGSSSSPGRRPFAYWPFPKAALVGPAVAVPHPDGPGVLLVDPEDGSSTHLTLDGAQVLGLLAPSGGRRLVTFEALQPVGEGDGEGGGVTAASGDDRRPRRHRLDLRVRLWDLEAIPAAPLAKLDELAVELDPWPNAIPLVAVDPEGRTVLVGRSDDSRVSVFDAEDGGRINGFGTGVGLSALAAGPDGLVATAGDGRVLLWEVDAWSGDAPLQLPGLSEPRGGAIRQLRFSPSGRLLAIVGMFTGVELWDPAANAPVAVVSTPTWVQDVAFADGRTLLVASGKTTEVWSIVEPLGHVDFEFPIDASPTRLPAFGRDGQVVMPLSEEAPRVWRADHCPTRARPWDLPGAPALSADVALSHGPDGRLLAFGAEGLSRFDSTDDAPPIDRLPWPESPEGDPPLEAIRLLASSPNHRALLLLRDFGVRPGSDPRGDRDGDRDRARSGPPGPDRPWRDLDQLWLWRADDGGGPGSLSLLLPPDAPRLRPDAPRNPVFLPAASLAPDGRRLYFLDRGELGAWALDGGRAEVVRSSPPEEGRYSSLALSPDGSLLALGGESGEVKLVSTATFRVVGVVPPAEPTGPRRAFALAFSPVEDLLAVGDASGELHLWGLGDRQAPSPRRLLRLSGSRYRMLGLGFSPDGRMLASIDVRPSEHRVVEFWELASLQDELSSLGLGW